METGMEESVEGWVEGEMAGWGETLGESWMEGDMDNLFVSVIRYSGTLPNSRVSPLFSPSSSATCPTFRSVPSTYAPR